MITSATEHERLGVQDPGGVAPQVGPTCCPATSDERTCSTNTPEQRSC